MKEESYGSHFFLSLLFPVQDFFPKLEFPEIQKTNLQKDMDYLRTMKEMDEEVKTMREKEVIFLLRVAIFIF